MPRLALRMLLRDWRAGELRVLALALVLAVGGVSSVAFFADRVTFVSMARAGKEALLTAVKAVTPGYPLRGKLRVAPALNTADAEIDAIPPRGTVWLDERMMASLKVRPGGAVELG